jgi:hypothetical protein
VTSWGPVYFKDTLLNGSPARIACIDVAGQTYWAAPGLLGAVRLEDEWFEEVRDPFAVIDVLKSQTAIRADLFTFCQLLPDVDPKFDFPHEWESIAALPVGSYEQWFGKQIDGATRNMIRKSRKMGVEVRECAFDDEFIDGIAAIFNETSVRQGRRFWHYGKDAETIKRQFSRFLFREDLIGAYCSGELIGFAMLGRSGRYAVLGQIISKVEHRDKAPTNALIAKAVEVCAARALPYLVYAFWTNDSLGAFKRRSGFQEVKLPRYFVPLTMRGKIALRLGVHKGWKMMLPPAMVAGLRRLRRDWFAWREK